MGAFHRLSVNMIGVSAQSLLSRPTNIGHPSGGFRVEKYRVYFVGRDGHFNGLEPIVCADDAAAIENAKRLVNRHGIELWNGARLVGRLEPMGQSAHDLH
jgi:hypothetical protein